MPLDGQGRHRPNPQLARHADKVHAMHSGGQAPSPGSAPGGDSEPMDGESIMHSTLHDHGDGTFHTEDEGGNKTEHPSMGHAMMHMAAKHAPGDKHMHVTGAGAGVTTHHVDENGEVHGPDEHGSADEAADHMRGVMDGDGGGEVPRHGDEDGYGEDLEYGN